MNVIQIHQTEAYARWFRRLRDQRAKARILVRIRSLSLGNPGDVEPVGKRVSEMRIHHGPGYRIYFAKRRKTLVLLAGGDKSTQQRDIRQAQELAEEL